MVKITSQITQLLLSQGCVIVTTIDLAGMPHSACKGIVRIEPEGRVYLLDLYRAKTHANLKRNPHLSITVLDEHKFTGYCLKGRGKIVKEKEINPELIKAWEDRVTSRITQRVLKNITDKKGHPLHPEALLPKPQYLIVMEVCAIVDLTPHHLRRG